MWNELCVERPTATVSDRSATDVLQAEADILRTMSVYCHAIDHGEAEVWAQCFAENGIYRVRYPGGKEREVVGREELTAYARAHESPPMKFPKHVSWAPVIDVEGRRAKARGMFAILNRGPQGPIVDVYGSYDDELVADPDGVWRFVLRLSMVEVASTTFQLANAPR